MSFERQPSAGLFPALVALALTATLLYFGTGLHPLWALTWIAPIPVLWIAFRSGAARAFAIAFLAFVVGELNLLHYANVLELPRAVRILGLAIPALAFAIGVFLARAAFVRQRYFAAVLLLPSFWTAYEFANSFGPNGTALNIAYSQMNFVPILQISSITGIWGISFCLMLFASAIAVWTSDRNARVPSTVALASVVVVLAFGALRLHSSSYQSQVTVGMAALDDRPLLGKEHRASGLISGYVKAIDSLRARGAEVIVLPEKIAVAEKSTDGALFQAVREAAIRNKVMVVYGVDETDRPLKHNRAIVISPTGDVLENYEKHYHVPDIEAGYEPGSTVAILASHPKWGVAICKDMDFPRFIREYAKRGAQVMLVPAWDFVVDDWFHGRMGVLRGVEGGFALVRSAKQGRMSVTDAYGRVLAEAQSGHGQAQLVYSLRYGPHSTLYTRLGDWFAWLNIALLAGLVGIVLVGKRKALPRLASAAREG